MTSKKEKRTGSVGRPQVEIDWEKVEELLVAGCMGTGIAAYLGMSAQTLYDRCLIEKGILFSQFSQEKKEKGDEILRAHQYAKALGLTDKGDNTLLIWLGKTRLQQKEEKQSDSKEISLVDLQNMMMENAALKEKLAQLNKVECPAS